MSLDDQKAKSDRFSETPNADSVRVNACEGGNRLEFNATEYIVHPAHGVGQILSIEEQTVAGASLEFFVIFLRRAR